MAKNVTIAEALSVLASAGIELGDEHADAIKELTRATYVSQAVAIIGGDDDKFPGKLAPLGKNASYTEEEFATEWANRLLSFAEDFANDFAGDVKNVQGGAVRMVRKVGIDTPVGHFVLELKSE